MKVFLYVLLFFNLISLLHLGLYIVGANMYDIKQLIKNKRAKKHSISAVTQKPLVSVIVPAHDESSSITRTLDSIRASTYQNIEIIVVDDGSTDNTAKIVEDYRTYLPDRKTVSYNRRNPRTYTFSRKYMHVSSNSNRMRRLVRQPNHGKGTAMNNAIYHHARGVYVMSLDADSILDRKAIERAVQYFEDPSIIGVAANVKVGGNNRWLTLLQRFEHMIGYRAKKFYAVSNSEFIVGGVASTYRMEVLRKAGLYDTDTQTEDIGLSLKLIAQEGNRGKKIMYAADVVAHTQGVQTFGALLKQRYRWKLGSLQNIYKYRRLILSDDTTKYGRMLTFYRLPMAVLSELMLLAGPILFIYIIALSISRQNAGIFLGAYLTVTLYALWTVWADEHLDISQKWRMSVQSFIVYPLFYVMDIVQVAAVVRCIFNHKKITFKQRTSSVWTSPKREGEFERTTFSVMRQIFGRSMPTNRHPSPEAA